MTNRLLIVGSGTEHDDIEKQVNGAVTLVKRCASPADLEKAVHDARTDFFRGEVIDVLDIYDHSIDNGVQLGSESLFLVEKETRTFVGREVAVMLREHLRGTAHLRLLACDVVFESELDFVMAADDILARRWLLVWLADLLGELRTVSGTNLKTNVGSFGPNGLKEHLANWGLFSSWAAIHGDPCEFDTQKTRRELLVAKRGT